MSGCVNLKLGNENVKGEKELKANYETDTDQRWAQTGTYLAFWEQCQWHWNQINNNKKPQNTLRNPHTHLKLLTIASAEILLLLSSACPECFGSWVLVVIYNQEWGTSHAASTKRAMTGDTWASTLFPKWKWMMPSTFAMGKKEVVWWEI